MKICLPCGRTCATRYEWAHHGCEVPGFKRETNRWARTYLLSPPTGASTPLIAVPVTPATLLLAPRR